MEVVDDSISQNIVVTGVLNMPVTDGVVQLTSAAIAQLNGAADVKALLNYKIRQGVSVSATYANNTITVVYTGGTLQIAVEDVTSQLSVNSGNYSYAANCADYENKVQNYEKQVFAPYGLVLAGSSSMENWTTSAQDLAPATTLNIAIGGTTAQMWLDCLAQRLIYPYNPRGVVLYVGVNDMKYIVEGKNILQSRATMANDTANTVIALLEDLHNHLPNSVVYYVLINKIPLARWNGQEDNWEADIDAFNNIIKQYAVGKSWLVLIDAGKNLESDGHSISAYFKQDAIHMNSDGYALWSNEIRTVIFQDETTRYKLQ